MESQSIEEKQQYLRQNIIDKGYDAEDFVQYCTASHNLSDLADWSTKKLKQVIKLYVQFKKSQNSKPYNPNNDDEQWSNFQETPTPVIQESKNQLKHEHQAHHNSSKSGNLVFSEADWDIFLGSGSSGPVSHNTNQVQNNEIKKPQSISIKQNTTQKLSLNEQKKVQNSQKKKPLTNQGKKNEDLQKMNKSLESNFQSIGKQNPLSPPSKDIKKQITNLSGLIEQGNIKKQNRGPINFTNVKLSTSKVKQMPKLPLINDIIITKTEQVSRNFLQSDYTLYYVHFIPGNHIIERKFADFRKLRGILQNMYPHIRLPYLEPEGWLTSSEGKDTETLAKYKWMIIDFLKYIIIRNEQLKGCPLVRKFCAFSTSLKSEKQYEDVNKQDLKKVFEFYESVSRPKSIGQLCLSNNIIILPPSNDGQKIVNNTLNVIQQIDHQYQKLRKKFDTLFCNYQLLAKSMSQVSSSFQTLQNLIKKYNFDNDQSKQFRIYEGIRQVCNKMHNSMNQQYVILKTRIKNILRYQKDNMMTLKQVFQTRNKIHSEYAKQGHPTLSKGSQTGGGQIQIDSNISLQEPCRNNKNSLCVQQIFWSHFIKQQTRCYWQQLRKKINEQLTMISYEQLDNQNDNLNFWNSMIKKCVV